MDWIKFSKIGPPRSLDALIFSEEQPFDWTFLSKLDNEEQMNNTPLKLQARELLDQYKLSLDIEQLKGQDNVQIEEVIFADTRYVDYSCKEEGNCATNPLEFSILKPLDSADSWPGRDTIINIKTSEEDNRYNGTHHIEDSVEIHIDVNGEIIFMSSMVTFLGATTGVIAVERIYNQNEPDDEFGIVIKQYSNPEFNNEIDNIDDFSLADLKKILIDSERLIGLVAALFHD
ncbi:MAG: hypothetical protein US52_C0064G0007 [candidate division WS6 bacterium GW2011_GWA2_37_6]|uniref:Uncharacterized protein n=1 Tax=candidate division WS6 bacterium GW2011_GWA2_37_6 TaxID=1619087 RepID=A0A0G0H6X7_9BACT|nr:MAG: hypothetical protein US52_C0064G0007 [candidate division WS6 bacterium GW2011_GWA2_37_6]